MTIELDLVIKTTEDSVDMKSGLTSMQGVSDAVRCIAESVLTKKVPERQTSKSSVRTSLKRSFKGSYGQVFSLDIYGDDANRRLRRIGHVAFVELIGYFMDEAIYRTPRPLSERAQAVVDNLGDTAEKIVHQLRVSALENIHEISVKFDHDILIRHRINSVRQTLIASFDRESAGAFHAIVSSRALDLSVVVTRLNIHTGNGRFQLLGENETVPFGFEGAYREIYIGQKKVFSSNLDYNNGLSQERWKYLRISARPVLLKDGRVVRYIITGVYNNEN